MGIDFFAAKGNKFYAPYGGGFLIAPKSFMDCFLPYQIGGGNLPYIKETDEFMRYQDQLAHDPGTPNAIDAVAMDLALRELSRLGLENIERYEIAMTRFVLDKLSQIPNVTLYVKPEHLASIVTFSIHGLSDQEVGRRLNEAFGIGVRVGNFCVYHVVRNYLGTTDKEIVPLVEAGLPIPGVVPASFDLSNSLIMQKAA